MVDAFGIHQAIRGLPFEGLRTGLDWLFEHSRICFIWLSVTHIRIKRQNIAIIQKLSVGMKEPIIPYSGKEAKP
jgi:hypothetical protein